MTMQTNNKPSLALMSKKKDYNRVGTGLVVSGDWVIGKEKHPLGLGGKPRFVRRNSIQHSH